MHRPLLPARRRRSAAIPVRPVSLPRRSPQLPAAFPRVVSAMASIRLPCSLSDHPLILCRLAHRAGNLASEGLAATSSFRTLPASAAARLLPRRPANCLARSLKSALLHPEHFHPCLRERI